MRLALFEPDIPQNTGALIRLGACLGVAVDIIEPCGFLWSYERLCRTGMAYLDRAEIVRHVSWQDFFGSLAGRLILLTTRAERSYTGFMFKKNDTLMLGRESEGVPEHVHEAVHARLRVPMQSGLRSLNVAQAGAIVLGEAMRQTNSFPQ